MFFSLDGTLLVQLLNFTAFFALLMVIYVRPVRRAIQRRRDYVETLLRDRAQGDSDIESLRSQLKSERHSARRSAEDQVLPPARGAGD